MAFTPILTSLYTIQTNTGHGGSPWIDANGCCSTRSRLGAPQAGELRLYRRGKLAGLFAQRTRRHGEIANQAVQDGLLEVTRVETVGKTTIEWVRVTPKGLDFLLKANRRCRPWRNCATALAPNQDGLPRGLPR